jgi:hypothetical protein
MTVAVMKRLITELGYEPRQRDNCRRGPVYTGHRLPTIHGSAHEQYAIGIVYPPFHKQTEIASILAFPLVENSIHTIVAQVGREFCNP